MSSSEASHAKTFPTLAEAPAWPGPVLDSTGSWCAPFAWFDRSTQSWRTWQRCLVEGWELFSETWPRAGMTRRGIAYRRQPLAPLTKETASGLLPTPEASNTKARAMRSGGRPPRDFLKPLSATPAFRLGVASKPTHSVPTPTASDHIERKSTSKEALNFDTNKTVSLDRWVKRFPTPTANDWKDAGYQKQTNGSRALTLSGAARMSEGHAYDRAAGGQLNPTWVEWLMGFPLGWTDLEPSETP